MVPLLLLLLLALPASAQGRTYTVQTEGPEAKQYTVEIKDGKKMLRKKAASPTTNKASGQRGVLLVSLSWPGSVGPSLQPEEYEGLPDWSASASGGRFRWNQVRIENVSLPQSYGCNDLAWARETRKRLAQRGIATPGNWGALGLFLPDTTNCVPTAYAYVGCFLERNYESPCGISVYSSQYTSYETVVHELGHTLGLGHSNSIPCQKNGEASTLTWSGDCEEIEYGDRYDIMGSSWTASLLHPSATQELGWTGPGEILRLPLDGETKTIALQSWGLSSGQRALHIPLPPEVPGGLSTGDIFLEYRARSGLDSLLYTGGSCFRTTPRDGLFLRYIPSDSITNRLRLFRGGPYLLDLSPGTEDICDSSMQPREPWFDPTGTLGIELIDRNGSAASVRVQTPALPPTTGEWIKPRKRKYRGHSFEMRMLWKAPVSDFDRADFYFRRGRCQKMMVFPDVPDYPDRRATLYLDGCRPGLTQIALRAGALLDQFGSRVPSSAMPAKTIRLLRNRR